MSLRLAAGVLALGLGVLPAHAQGLPSIGSGEKPRIKLDVSVEEAMLIVSTLEAISCGSVRQMVVCQEAARLLAAIREQAKAQQR